MNKLLFTVLFASTAFADNHFDTLSRSLTEMRTAKPEGPRGASPQLTTVKHALRDWVESRLKDLPRDGDEGLLQRKLNAELRDAGLFCGERAQGQHPCADWTLLGYLAPLTFQRSEVFIILETRVGIECGFDDSAYVFSYSDEGWRRVWQTEQTTYTKKEYAPQTLQKVLISPINRENNYLVLTLGTEPWCVSNWRRVYYRAFRLGPDPDAGLLVEGAEDAYLGSFEPIRGSVTTTDVLVEFTVRSIDAGVHSRPAVRHFKIDSVRGVRRTDPLALTPRDFVDEWLTHDWKEAAFWSESPNRGPLHDRHKMLHKDFVAGDFIYPTMHCPSMPDMWQVGVDFEDSRSYFLVRWKPPYTFSMIDVKDQPAATCTEEDRKLDDEPHTLFPDAR